MSNLKIEMQEVEEPDHPQEGDLVISGNNLAEFEGKWIGRFSDPFEAAAYYMKKPQFFPNVWWLSDHGNLHLITSFYK